MLWLELLEPNKNVSVFWYLKYPILRLKLLENASPGVYNFKIFQGSMPLDFPRGQGPLGLATPTRLKCNFYFQKL